MCVDPTLLFFWQCPVVVIYRLMGWVYLVVLDDLLYVLCLLPGLSRSGVGGVEGQSVKREVGV